MERMFLRLMKSDKLASESPGKFVKVFCWASPSLVEKAMAPHSRTLGWKIPWMEEPGRLQSMGSLRVRHD